MHSSGGAGSASERSCPDGSRRSTLFRPDDTRPSSGTRSRTANRRPLLTTIDQQQHVEREPALAQAAEDVTRAKLDIRELLRGNLDKTWTIRELQASIDEWSGTIVSLALMDMRRDGEVEMTDDLGIRVLKLQPV